MAATDAAKQAILDKIVELTPDADHEPAARAVLDLAEAYAWLVYQGQPHGSNAVMKSS